MTTTASPRQAVERYVMVGATGTGTGPWAKSRRRPRSRSSQYGGVTLYRGTGRWESPIWSCSLPLCPGILLILFFLQFFSEHEKQLYLDELFLLCKNVFSYPFD
ncbi:hypothetical protein QYE76_002603 [Lolium multiflorum]|uniref:Uncharacterized protein n=1 Tax=Lolium multiflorum TaxID=4521 RepID=A0AAD8RM00_LOLMU|nr:hypothetical protein QYE76_002603 [Lolium multiflorum]